MFAVRWNGFEIHQRDKREDALALLAELKARREADVAKKLPEADATVRLLHVGKFDVATAVEPEAAPTVRIEGVHVASVNERDRAKHCAEIDALRAIQDARILESLGAFRVIRAERSAQAHEIRSRMIVTFEEFPERAAGIDEPLSDE